MGRFETPTSNHHLAAKLQGLDLEAVSIARSEAKRAKLDDFVATYITPDTLDYEANGVAYSYDYRRISALGRAGTLLHARLHKYPILDLEPGVRNLVVVDSIDSTVTTELWPARSEEVAAGPTRSGETVLGIGYIPMAEQGLRPVPDGTTEAEWEEQQELARILEQEALRSSTPQIRFGNAGWTYRHANGMLEPLRDLLVLQQSVHLAVSRGLGAAAIEPAEYKTDQVLQQTGSMGN